MSTDSELTALREQAARCTDCDLHRNATQTVFGEGSPSARVMFIGEQPGDKEDIAGEPFVGPAGQLLDRAFTAAGIDRKDVYITNAVKHFKWKPRGKIRLHQKPNVAEVRACRHWLDSEIGTLRPEVLVSLGATAAQALLGSSFRLTQHRGEWQTFNDVPLLATIHPSAILRMQDEERESAFEELVADLRLVKERM